MGQSPLAHIYNALLGVTNREKCILVEKIITQTTLWLKVETHFVFQKMTTAAPFDQTAFVPMNLKMQLLVLKPNWSLADKSGGAFKNISPILQFPLIQILISCVII